MITNYDTLVNVVRAYLQRTDPSFEEMIPVFVQLAQERITKELKILDVIRMGSVRGGSAETSLVLERSRDGTAVLYKPKDWLATVSLFAAMPDEVTVPLQIRTLAFVMNFNGATVLPFFYADRDNSSCLLSKFTGEKVNFILQYYGKIPFLTPRNQSNIIVETLPQLFLYATLLETASFLREDERLQTWAMYYEKMKEAVGVEDLKRIQQGGVATH